MPTSVAHVPTASASRYLQQLCKHWGHKFTVEFDAQRGRVDLPMGPLVMDASPDVLIVTLQSKDPAGFDRFEAVVADHIKRFAFREELAFDWTRTIDA
jgi:hypothetical protein